MKKDGKENHGAKAAPQTTEEKAQYEVFRNGNIPRETIDEWCRNDLNAIASFVQVVRSDANVFRALTDAMWARYKGLHEKLLENQKMKQDA